ncbi:hypothetical protein N798_03660 [Knoellia flava TL1]|uniref:Ig-like domain-containing protein n=2 Tax=Knoellia flava TaxID=913969 RepID=A0A8H9FW19_9MICO|nr:PxKF domain-containing protein [Knoellia flava]KGN35248.1 hypothetical protein N798_03660 [Knoellia flava TL1]GGB89851.1 hypothetical protein GCM10011314_32130 [Knoellia flava]
MNRSLLRRASVAAVAALTLAAGAATASADDIVNNIDATIDPEAEVMPLTVGGADGTTTLRVVTTGGDGKPGCNLTGQTVLTVAVTSSDPTKATVSPNSVSFDSCSATRTITVHPVAAGSSTVTLSQTGNNTGGTFTFAPATFSVNVSPATPTNTAPSVDVTGVTSGTAYEFGSVPTAMCQVTDAEDGPSSFVATLSAVTGGPAARLGQQTASCTYKDRGGLTAVSSVTYSVVDTTAPVISLVSRLPKANDAGWNNSDVTVTWSCSDAFLDETASVSQAVRAEGEGQSATGTCTDPSGNSVSNTVSGINIDKTAPTIEATLSPDADSSTGWWNIGSGAPTVTYACGDALAGVASCTGGHTFGEGADQAHEGTAIDKAGNSARAEVSGVDVDLTAPTISAALGSASSFNPAPSGWWNKTTGAPTVTYSCDDIGSGLAAGACPAAHTFADGEDQSQSGTVHDRAGNSATAEVTNVDVDVTAPTISAALDSPSSSSPGASGWWNTTTGAPTVTYTCNDDTSGVVDCPASHTFAEGENQDHSATVYDEAGNSASNGVANVDVDLTAPGVTWVGGPADGASYYFGSVPAAGTCTATDALSGPVNDCSIAGYQTSTGTKELVATAHDVAGNTTTAQRNYTVLAWTLKGFYQPVDMNGVLNTVKNGSTVPLKFEVFSGSTELTDTSVVQSFKVTNMSCSTNVATDDIELTTSGSTVLRYDATGGQFIQNWQTPKSPGSCYLVTMTTQDGSKISANFKLK